jgi:DNA-directed RNA polymerase specialized sigma24 family protein
MSDRDQLEILYLKDSGLSFSQISALTGVSKSAAHRAYHRTEYAPCACRKPENKDGGMSERWWA